MRYLVNGREMKEIDMRSIHDYGIPSLVLMERAALEVAKEAERLMELKKMHVSAGKGVIWSVCGLGNNGADGAAAARILHLRGYTAVIILPSVDDRMSKEMEIQLSIAEKLGIPIHRLDDLIPGVCDMVIDAVFGIGLTRPVEGAYAELMELINTQREEFGAKVVSVDIPSGISSECGGVLGCAVRADATVTFGEMKIGHVLFPGRQYSGTVTVADIGFVPVDEEAAKTYVRTHTKEDLMNIPKRAAYSHKGNYGKILVVAGAKNMAGAAYFAAKAAYRTGAGLVKVLTAEENRTVIQEKLPEAILATYSTECSSHEQVEFKDYIRNQTDWADVIILGPGIGTEEYSRVMVEAVLEYAYVPIILDADAINLAARYPYLKKFFTENLILTPHLSECSRLTGKTVDEIRETLVETAREVSEQYGVTCVLKDAATVIARKDGKVFVNMSGSSAMAKGGSGDVLSGVIAGLLGLGMDECEAASLGVYIHGLAGEAAARKFGVHSVLAGELADFIGEVINETV